jgi:hypothetical protein
MARTGGRERIAVRTSTWEGSNVLEWRPRLFALIFVVVLVGLVAGYFEFNAAALNWEW